MKHGTGDMPGDTFRKKFQKYYCFWKQLIDELRHESELLSEAGIQK